MRKGLFTVVFMVSITVVFISVLAFVNEISRERIAKNQEIRRIRSIMYACNIFPGNIHETDLSPSSTTTDIPWDVEQLLDMVNARMKVIHLPNPPSQKRHLQNSFLSLRDSVQILLIRNVNDEIDGYGFNLRGKGLWGTIAAFAVVSSDFTRMIGIDFTEQVETPGLGARITESEFKYLFRGLNLKGFFERQGNQTVIDMVSKKEKTNLEESTNTIQAITGATQTCNGVLNMLNTDLRFYISLLRENQEWLKESHS